VPTAIEATALSQTNVFIHGGQRGLQIQLDPNRACAALGAIVRQLTA
jgi:Cys-tRNA(Pro)/Cys-tRNA(Cys) deacylase